MFLYRRLSQDGSALSDDEKATLEELKTRICAEDFEQIQSLRPHQGLEVESDSGTRYFVYRTE